MYTLLVIVICKRVTCGKRYRMQICVT